MSNQHFGGECRFKGIELGFNYPTMRARLHYMMEPWSLGRRQFPSVVFGVSPGGPKNIPSQATYNAIVAILSSATAAARQQKLPELPGPLWLLVFPFFLRNVPEPPPQP